MLIAVILLLIIFSIFFLNFTCAQETHKCSRFNINYHRPLEKMYKQIRIPEPFPKAEQFSTDIKEETHTQIRIPEPFPEVKQFSTDMHVQMQPQIGQFSTINYPSIVEDVYTQIQPQVHYVETQVTSPVDYSNTNPITESRIEPETVKMTYGIIKKFDLEVEPQSLYNFLTTYKTNNLVNTMYNIFVGFEDIPTLKKLEIAEFVVWKSMNQKHINDIYEEIVRISKDPTVDNKTKANCIDMLMRSNNKKYIDISNFLLSKLRAKENNETRYHNVNQIRNQVQKLEGQLAFNPFISDDENVEMQEVLFDQIRRLRAQEFNLHENDTRKQTVYLDSQNVHNHEINNKVMDAASAIVQTDDKPRNLGMSLNMPIEDELKRVYPDYQKNKSAIEASLRRIETDPAKFRGGMTTKVIFDKIVEFIARNKHKDELLKRLAEELVDMNGLCSTGHVSRLVNTLQGFPDLPEELTIKINPKDEIYANIQTYLNNTIQNDSESEKMIDDMLSDNPIDNQRYFKFVKDKMVDKCKELEKEYNGIVDKELLYLNIEDSLNTYMKNPKGVLYIMSEIRNLQ